MEYRRKGGTRDPGVEIHMPVIKELSFDDKRMANQHLGDLGRGPQ